MALDRDSTYYGGGAQVELTPLTTFLVDVEAGEDRFVLSPERDADTYKVMPGFKFKPFALINGELGPRLPRSSRPSSPLVPDYGGVIAQVDLGYTLRATRFDGEFNRDITYSFETIEPYYLQTDWGLSVTQKITHGLGHRRARRSLQAELRDHRVARRRRGARIRATATAAASATRSASTSGWAST